MRFTARLCWWLDVHRWAISASNILAAALFVAGCIGFFWPGLYVLSVTMFLAGSLLFLLSALASALLDHGPTPSPGHAHDNESRQLRPARGNSVRSTPAA
jgi:YrhK-like protein